MRALLVCTLMLFVCFGASADDKVDAKRLVGKWLPKAGDKEVEFTKDGKLVVLAIFDEKDRTKDRKIEGVYKVDGNKLIITVKVGEKEYERTHTIFDVTDTELITIDENGKKEFSTRMKVK